MQDKIPNMFGCQPRIKPALSTIQKGSQLKLANYDFRFTNSAMWPYAIDVIITYIII